MNASSPHRFLKALATIAAVSVAAFSVSLVLDVRPLALFSVATSAMILLGVARDYAPTLGYSTSVNTAVATRSPERHALAA